MAFYNGLHFLDWFFETEEVLYNLGRAGYKDDPEYKLLKALTERVYSPHIYLSPQEVEDMRISFFKKTLKPREDERYKRMVKGLHDDGVVRITYSATEVAQMVGLSLSRFYEILREVRDELPSEYYIRIGGKGNYRFFADSIREFLEWLDTWKKGGRDE